MKDRLAEIFERQASYVWSLGNIERSNDLWPGIYPLRLEGRKAQEHFRLLAWRFTEEILEAVAAPKETYVEEVADAFHFLIELALATDVNESALLSGVRHVVAVAELDFLTEVFQQEERALRDRKGRWVSWWDVIQMLGTAMQLLKQRPWRTDFRPTAEKDWVLALSLVFRRFIQGCISEGITADILYDAYFSKAKINDARTTEQRL
jgi:hypothetical protein